MEKNKIINYGSLIRNAKDIDSKKGIVSFYFAEFHTTDAHGRRMHQNAFKRTIKNNINKIYHLYNHDNNQVIGKPMEIGTDEKGAFMVSKLTRTQLGKDMLILYEDGIINEHSFGFYINKSHEDGEIEIVDEVKMVEASSLTTQAANPNTPTISVNQMDKLLRYSELSDEILKKLDEILAHLPVLNTQGPAAEQPKENGISFDELLKIVKTYKK